MKSINNGDYVGSEIKYPLEIVYGFGKKMLRNFMFAGGIET